MAKKQIRDLLVIITLISVGTGCGGSGNSSGSEPQSGVPTPAASPRSSVNYGLYFSIPASDLLTGKIGSTPLNLGPQQQLTDTQSNCGVSTVTYQSDGEITCFINSTCPAEQTKLPGCVFEFSAAPSPTVNDVVNLVELMSNGQAIPATTPGQVEYGLYFSIGASKLLTGQTGTPLNLGPQQQLTDTTSSCTTAQITYQVDGPIACFTNSNCPADSSRLPFCVFGFTAAPGYPLSSVVTQLLPIPNTGGSPGASSSASTNGTPDAATLFRAFRNSTGNSAPGGIVGEPISSLLADPSTSLVDLYTALKSR